MTGPRCTLGAWTAILPAAAPASRCGGNRGDGSWLGSGAGWRRSGPKREIEGDVLNNNGRTTGCRDRAGILVLGGFKSIQAAPATDPNVWKRMRSATGFALGLLLAAGVLGAGGV